jgi:hypothetical protein
MYATLPLKHPDLGLDSCSSAAFAMPKSTTLVVAVVRDEDVVGADVTVDDAGGGVPS